MKTIILIEDNDDIRENTAEILQLANYKVFTASNGKEGVEIALKHKPDLIICDIMMPILDGYGVLHLLNKNAETAGIPFIFLTAKTERSDLRKGMEMGADDYITKPFDDIELLKAIEGRLKKVENIKLSNTQQEEFNSLISQAKAYQELKLLSDEREMIELPKKQIIFREEGKATKAYFINKGKVKTYRTNENAKELITGIYSEGDYFGYLSLLENKPYTDTAETLEDVELTIIPKDDFLMLVDNNPIIAKQFISLLSNKVDEKEKQLLNIAYNSLRKRVANGLLLIMEQYKDGQEHGIHISRDDLAKIVGTATESLIRTLSDFKSEKMIDIKDGRIFILQQKKLENLLN